MTNCPLTALLKMRPPRMDSLRTTVFKYFTPQRINIFDIFSLADSYSSCFGVEFSIWPFSTCVDFRNKRVETVFGEKHLLLNAPEGVSNSFVTWDRFERNKKLI